MSVNNQSASSKGTVGVKHRIIRYFKSKKMRHSHSTIPSVVLEFRQGHSITQVNHERIGTPPKEELDLGDGKAFCMEKSASTDP